MTNKKNIILVLMILVSSLALGFDLELKAITNSIDLNDIATFNLTIENGLNAVDSFTITSPEAQLDWTIIPAYVSDVPAEGEKTILLQLSPKALLSQGRYHAVPITITSRKTGSAEVIEASVFIEVTGTTNLEYEPSILANTFVRNEGGEDGKINPAKPIIIIVDVTNKNTRNIEGYTIKIVSDLFEKEIYSSLDPEEQGKIEEIIFEIDALTNPQQISLDTQFIIDGEEVPFHETHKTIEIKGISTEFTIESSFEDYFLKQTKRVKLANDGNVERKETVKMPTSFWAKIFTSTVPQSYVIKEEGAIYLSWDVELEAGKSSTIERTVNYRPALVVAIILFILIAIYWIAKPAVTITKTTVTIGKKEGGVSELKVLLHVKNISDQPARNVILYDTIPTLAEFIRDESLGTMQPKKIRNYEKKGTIAEWEIPTLEANEERIISYKIRSRLSIVGHFRLPNASVKYDTKKRRRESVSNSVRVINN